MTFHQSIGSIVHQIIAHRSRGTRITLLAVCPNSDAVLEAAVKTTAANHMPMLFAATLNQVDQDGGYTGWTPHSFVQRMWQLAEQYQCASPLYPCLDHGGPWLKDAHSRDQLTLTETMDEVKTSLVACLEAGYALLHIDPTVDRTLPPGRLLDIEVVVERTVELIQHTERARTQRNLPPVAYEVGTEEVHGGLADLTNFGRFVQLLRDKLAQAKLLDVWPAFIVGKVGTDLATTTFDPAVAQQLYQHVAPHGSLIKGHYTDWVSNPAAYPQSGMGGANVGPEFTAAELEALRELVQIEHRLLTSNPTLPPSNFEPALEQAVVRSGRWQKWLTPQEAGREFSKLAPERREWLVATGARYVWTQPEVLSARDQLYLNVQSQVPAPHDLVIDRIAAVMQNYVAAFNLQNSCELFSL
jgi:D-tagatose-1,6-bisphosphate aldolase subunit GatZ/KbaZ